MNTATQQLSLKPDNPQFLATLSGQFNEHLKSIAKRLQVSIHNRGNLFEIQGTNADQVELTARLLYRLYNDIAGGLELDTQNLQLYLQESGMETLNLETLPMHDDVSTNQDLDKNDTANNVKNLPVIQTPNCKITPRGKNQKNYVQAIREHTVNFGIGPAGTGKTYLAVACAVEALRMHQVERILLVRPAVEAGEKLGFLPGDLTQKIDPYVRPLYDALYEMLGFETVSKLIEKHVIEVAPLAFMRGRTLNHAFVILDESQNTTSSQMKMFLTRIGAGTKAVITGDLTQTDLPSGKQSGLTHAQKVLQNIPGIYFTRFASKDVVRHSLVQKIVEAYEEDQESGHHQQPEKKPRSDSH